MCPIRRRKTLDPDPEEVPTMFCFGQSSVETRFCFHVGLGSPHSSLTTLPTYITSDRNTWNSATPARIPPPASTCDTQPAGDTFRNANQRAHPGKMKYTIQDASFSNT